MKDKGFEFRLVGMEVLQSEIVGQIAKQDASVKFHFDISIEMKVNQKEEAVLISPMVKIRINEKPEYVGKLRIALVLNIKSFHKYFNSESNIITLPSNIQNTFNSIAISTLRGVMFNHFKGTYLHNAILPIIDPKSFNID
jgi:hypothetical protein